MPGEGWPLIRTRQPIGGQCRQDAADQLIKAQFCHIIDRRGRDLVAGQRQCLLIAVLAVLVRPARGRQPSAQPAFQELAQAMGPGAWLEPQWCSVGHHRDPAARAQQRDGGGEQRLVPHPVQGLADGHRGDRPRAEQVLQRWQEGIDQDINDGPGIAMAIPVIEPGHLAAEP